VYVLCVAYVSPYDSTVASRLKSNGAIVIGKTSLDEFGMGSFNDTGSFPPVLNPHDVNRTAGGSSGGAAAALASQTCLA
jgi:aspartyl-tRNA(Asn)/glutamyl-tRNA(Gln) amidotransferase subunit A